MRNFLRILAPLVLLSAPAPAQDAAAPRVSVAAAHSREITEEAVFIGRVEAMDTVEIMARVSGFLEEKLIGDGSRVDEGDLLFRIEPDAYQAALESRAADLARAEANLDLADVELQRKAELVRREAAPVSERDVAEASKAVAEADVKAAEAAIRQAELDLGYTEIRAPFAGKIGRIEASEGDVVGPNNPPLATLVRQDPIYVTFSLSEKQFVTVLEAIGEAGGPAALAERGPEVFVTLPNGKPLDTPGRIAFVDNRIDPQTGTMTLRAVFPNDARLLIDGSFVNVRIQALAPVERLLIPQAALQRDQRGEFVLVVRQDQTVEQRYVTTGKTYGTEAVIQDGLREGEALIVEGLQRVRPGVAVEPVMAGVDEG